MEGMRETREARGGDEVAERGTVCVRVCVGEEAKGVQRAKYSLHKSNDRTLNYSKESRLLCVMFDAVPQQPRFFLFVCFSLCLTLKEDSEWSPGFRNRYQSFWTHP